MRRKASLVLLAFAVFCAALSPLMRWYAFPRLANEVNDHMPEYVVRRIGDQLNRDGIALHGSRVLVLGLAYKPNTGDARESPSRR